MNFEYAIPERLSQRGTARIRLFQFLQKTGNGFQRFSFSKMREFSTIFYKKKIRPKNEGEENDFLTRPQTPSFTVGKFAATPKTEIQIPQNMPWGQWRERERERPLMSLIRHICATLEFHVMLGFHFHSTD